MMAPLLRIDGISKRFGETVAADGLTLDIEAGQLHAILGENGAGKSTLMKMIYGVLQPDDGQLLWKGEPVTFATPAEARGRGIGMVFQHFSLFETLTVVENTVLTTGLAKGEARTLVSETSERFGLDVNPDALVHGLSVGQRQRVEIIRALIGKPQLLIMDEPTSVLPPTAIPRLFRTLRELANEGCAILFISHKLSEIRDLCHTATIMRAGKLVGTVDPTVTDEDALARLMIGRDIPHPTRPAAKLTDAPLLSIRDVFVDDADPFAVSLKSVSLDVHGGEIVGIAGVSGNGQRLLAGILSGEVTLPAAQGDRIQLLGQRAGHLGCAARRTLGMSYVPEERNGRGAVPPMSLAENVMLTSSDHGMVRRGLIDRRATTDRATACIASMDVRCQGPTSEARSLSGGNLQKFIMGRELDLGPKVFIAAQPTWGVDVGAAQAIRQRMADLRSEGVAVVVISEELEELIELSDRLYVLFRGSLSPAIARADMRDDLIGRYMAGDTRQPARQQDTTPPKTSTKEAIG